jgi:hypothetical protein
VRACAIVTCSACYAFCACRKSASKYVSRTPCCAFCAFCARRVCCFRSARAACYEATRAARIVPRGALPDRNVPSVDNGIENRSSSFTSSKSANWDSLAILPSLRSGHFRSNRFDCGRVVATLSQGQGNCVCARGYDERAEEKKAAEQR